MATNGGCVSRTCSFFHCLNTGTVVINARQRLCVLFVPYWRKFVYVMQLDGECTIFNFVGPLCIRRSGFQISFSRRFVGGGNLFRMPGIQPLFLSRISHNTTSIFTKITRLPVRSMLFYVVGSRRLIPTDALQPKAYCKNPGL